MNITMTERANDVLKNQNHFNWLIKYQTDDCG